MCNLKLTPQVWVLTIAIVLFTSLFASAQNVIDQTRLAPMSQMGTEANYYYANPGDLTILVSIWGFVQRPGVYEISNTIDLIRLISLAGGPQSYAKLKKVRIIRVYNQEKKEQEYRREFIINLSELTKLTPEDIKLYPGDTIIVDHTTWYTVKDVLTSLATVAIFLTAASQLIIATSRY